VNDVEFIARFEDGTLPGEKFRHCDHVRMAWLYLSRYPLLEALVRFSDALQRFATAHGKPDLYHQTITWSYLFLINERRERLGANQSWQKFAAANGDLFAWNDGGILSKYYRPETLQSEFARKVFVFPDQSGWSDKQLHQ
jgi:hypothetical protein